MRSPIKWGDLLKRRGVESGKQRDERSVPIQTGGVFAEAVLSRASAPQKLDITRFWNWQDSPIPLSPSDIAPVANGSRGTAANLVPGRQTLERTANKSYGFHELNLYPLGYRAFESILTTS